MNTPITPEATYTNGLNNGAYPITFEMKGNWDNDKELPEEDAKPGDCYIWKGHFWARTSLDKWADYGDLTNTGTVQATFLQDHRQPPRPVIFRKVDRPDVTISIIGDFVNDEIARCHAPKEGKMGEAYVVGEMIYLWYVEQGGWIQEGKVGQYWEPVPHQVGDDFLRELYEADVRANYPGTFEEWRLQTRFDIKALSQYAGKAPKVTPPRTEDKFLQELYQDDVKAGYNGTMGEWQSQNGDLNALLRKGLNKNPQDHVQLSYVQSLEEQRRRMHKQALLADSKEHPSLDDVSTLLEGALTKLESQESDAAFKALDALKKVKVDLRRKRRNTWLRWMLFWAILGGVVYGLYKWIPTQVVTGRYTVPKTCSVPFGKDTITGMRYYNYSYKSLFGVHFTLESTVREQTDVTKNGQEFTVFGLSPRNEDATEEEMALADKVLKAAEVEVEGVPKPPKGKWWRINVWPSDKGTQWMKPAELYLFASEKYTTMVAYKDFCK
jgi:hypothetical protein